MRIKLMRELAMMLFAALSVGLVIAGASDDKDKTKGKLSTSDADFLTEAWQGGMLEVRLGRLASEKSTNADVKNFGEMMKDDHTKVNDQLKQLAVRKGVKLDSKMEKAHMDTYSRLSRLSGTEFDKEYMDLMVDDHEEDVDKFQKMAEVADDPDVKSFASKHLSTLKHHLQEAKRIDGSIKGMSKNI
ncbi:MAG: DUF4142 domain-containing protein [Ignavibacteriae bacterium]|nr:DUF4142 domain-containing protein [Ignavibacteriota bacterium]